MTRLYGARRAMFYRRAAASTSSGVAEVTDFTFSAGSVIPTDTTLSYTVSAEDASTMDPVVNRIQVNCVAASHFPIPVNAMVSPVCPSKSGINPGSYFTIQEPLTGFTTAVWFNVTGSDTYSASYDGNIEVNLSGVANTPRAVGDAVVSALISAGYSAEQPDPVGVPGELNIFFQPASGFVFTDYDSGCYVSGIYDGVPAGYFLLDDDGWYVYFNVSGLGGDPRAAVDAIEVQVSSSDPATAVAIALSNALTVTGFENVRVSGTTVTFSPIVGPTATDYGTTLTFSTLSAVGPSIYFQLSNGTYISVWYNINSACSAPTFGTPIPVVIADTDLAASIATATKNALVSAGYSAISAGALVTVTRTGNSLYNRNCGSIHANFVVESVVNESAARYFTFNDPSDGVMVPYMAPESIGAVPAVSGTKFRVAFLETATNSQVAEAFRTAVAARGYSASRSGNVVTLTNRTTGVATDASVGTVTAGLSISVTTQGS